MIDGNKLQTAKCMNKKQVPWTDSRFFFFFFLVSYCATTWLHIPGTLAFQATRILGNVAVPQVSDLSVRRQLRNQMRRMHYMYFLAKVASMSSYRNGRPVAFHDCESHGRRCTYDELLSHAVGDGIGMLRLNHYLRATFSPEGSMGIWTHPET